MKIGEERITVFFDSITITSIVNHKKDVILKLGLVNQCVPMIEHTFTLREGDTMKIKGLDIRTEMIVRQENGV